MAEGEEGMRRPFVVLLVEALDFGLENLMLSKCFLCYFVVW
jgi:hypothetical protein